MPKQISWGIIDTPVDGAQQHALERPVLNFSEDFRIKTDKPEELTLVNTTGPMDRKEQLRFASSTIRNIYNGTDIDESVYAPSKQGVSILAQVTDTLSVTDDVDADYRVDLPVSAHLVVKVPNSEFITADIVETLISRLISSLYETNDDSTKRLDAMLRGSLAPRGV